MFARITLSSVMFLSICAAAAARTISVGSEPGADFSDIQPAIRAASPGDSILVGPGRFSQFHRFYSWDGGWEGRSLAIVDVDDLYILGSGRDTTILGPPSLTFRVDSFATGGIFVQPGLRVVVKDLRIDNVSFPMTLLGTTVVESCRIDRSAREGGATFAINAFYGANDVFRDCIFTCTDALAFWGPDYPLVEDCTFVDPTFSGYAILFTYGLRDGVTRNCTVESAESGVAVQFGATAQVESLVCEAISGAGVSTSSASVVVRDLYVGPGARFGCFNAGPRMEIYDSTITSGELAGVTNSFNSLTVVRGCNFLMPAQRVLNNVVQSPGRILDARGNWWGTTDEEDIRSRSQDENGRTLLFPAAEAPFPVAAAQRARHSVAARTIPSLSPDWQPAAIVEANYLGGRVPPPPEIAPDLPKALLSTLPAGTNSQLKMIDPLTPIYGGTVSWADFDGDSDPDLLVSGTGISDSGGFLEAKTVLHRNVGSGYEVVQTADLPELTDAAIPWADIEGDGDLDLLLLGHGTTGERGGIYRYQFGSFQMVAAEIPFSTRFGAAAWADFDNDGDMDLAANGQTLATTIYRNRAGSFESIPTGPPVAFDGALAWFDHGADGDMDLFVMGWSGERRIATILLNDDGNFSPSDIELPGLSMGHAAFGDLDSDGYDDLVCFGLGDRGPATYIFRQSSTGAFEPLAHALPPLYDGEAAWGDYDNDGDLDLLITGKLDAPGDLTRLYVNASGELVDSGIEFPGLQSSAVAWADHDRDGDLDFAICGNHQREYVVTAVYENRFAIPRNARPDPPTPLPTSVQDGRLTLSWLPGADFETPTSALSYALRIGSSPGADDVLPSMALAASGERLVPGLGPIRGRTDWSLRLPHGGPYYASIQTIDAGFGASSFVDFDPVSVAVLVSGFRAQWLDGSCVEVVWSSTHALTLQVLEASGWRDTPARFEDDRGWHATLCSHPPTRYRLTEADGTVVAETVVAGAPSAVGDVWRLSIQPNPARYSAQVEASLPVEEFVQIEVFDLRGRRVRTLLQGRQPAGLLELSWDGRDDAGVPVASGSYLIALRTEQHFSSSRVLYLQR